MPTNTFTRTLSGFERTPLTKGGLIATPNADATPEQIAAAQAGGWLPAPRTVPLTSDSPLAQPPVPQVQTPQPTNAADSFNYLITDLLNQAKGLGTADLLKRKRELERESLRRVGSSVGEGMALSPSQQNTIREGSADALSPEIDQNKYELAKATQAIDNFEKVYTEAKKFGEDFANKMVAPESVIQAYVKAIEEKGIDSASIILSGANDKTKQAVLSSLDYTKVKSKASGDTPAAVKEYEYAKANGYTGTFSDWKNSSGTNVINDNERALMGQFMTNPIVKDYNTVISQKLYTDRIIKNGVGGPADLALIFSFMKSLDPNSVVREAEYDTASKSGNIFAGIFAKFNGYLKPEGGFLPESVQKEFQNLVNNKLKAQQVQYDNFASSYKDIARRQGLNPDNVVPNLGGALDEVKEVNGVKYKRVPGGWQKVTFNQVGSDTNSASNKKEIVAGYDITSYATDPNHGVKVAGIYYKIPPMEEVADVDRYIQKTAPGSPVQGSDVLAASSRYDVDPKLVLAIMVQDSSLGTEGKAVWTYNPGNVGNTDSGATQKYRTWGEGVDAVAKNLAWRKIS